MKEKIVQTAHGITVLGAGRTSQRKLASAMALAPYLLAADGGAKKALKFGLRPDAVIGDLDSASMQRLNLPKNRIHLVAEQDSTDFEKCLYSLEAPFVIALGVTGSRFDHSLAAMNALLKHPKIPVIVVSGKDLIFLCPPELHLSLPIGTRLSLFPMGPVTGQQSGLHHPIKGLNFDPTGRIGTSNRTSAADIHLRFDAPNMLVILPWRHLATVVASLSKTPY